jgi:hypothetical protein
MSPQEPPPLQRQLFKPLPIKSPGNYGGGRRVLKGEKRELVQLYLDDKASKRQKAAQAELLETARSANMKSIVALVIAIIFAVVAMLALFFG